MSHKTILHVGFDDTDSPKGMCTTFLAFKMVDYLKSQDTDFVDFPKLIRFNPNIPWKTRGNGAVSFTIKTSNPTKVKNKIKNFVAKFSDVENGANPGLVFLDMFLKIFSDIFICSKYNWFKLIKLIFKLN